MAGSRSLRSMRLIRFVLPEQTMDVGKVFVREKVVRIRGRIRLREVNTQTPTSNSPDSILCLRASRRVILPLLFTLIATVYWVVTATLVAPRVTPFASANLTNTLLFVGSNGTASVEETNTANVGVSFAAISTFRGSVVGTMELMHSPVV